MPSNKPHCEGERHKTGFHESRSGRRSACAFADPCQPRSGGRGTDCHGGRHGGRPGAGLSLSLIHI
ncbi:MAG TPA: hypothetical protein DCQ35_13505, partial [Rhodospirillum rubrum]|nr:hypothetical protein [Rhodospirillum rubrum]